MPEAETPRSELPDPAEVGRTMADIAERSQRILAEWLKRQDKAAASPDPLNIGQAFMELTAQLMADPEKAIAMGEQGRSSDRPQFTDHCFTGDYPTGLTDQSGDSPKQLSLLAEAG